MPTITQILASSATESDYEHASAFFAALARCKECLEELSNPHEETEIYWDAEYHKALGDAERESQMMPAKWLAVFVEGGK